jgi:hypothetical protein
MKERLRLAPFLPWALFALGMLGVSLYFVCNGWEPGKVGDGTFNLCVLEHFYRASRGLEKSFVDGCFFYPWPCSMAFSDTFWANGPLYALLRTFGLQPTDAYRVWFLIGNALNFFVAYYVLLKLGLKELGAGVGAFLFSFCLPASAQFAHIQLTYRFGVPLGVFFLDRYLRTRTPLYASLTLLVLALQSLCTLYISFFLGYLLVAYLLAWLFYEKLHDRRSFAQISKNLLPVLGKGSPVWPALGIGLMAGALLVLAFWPYLEVSRLYAFKRDWRIIKYMLPRPASYFLADASRLWSFNTSAFEALPMRHEHQMFLGLGALVAMAMATFRAKWFLSERVLILMRTSFFVVVALTLCLFDHTAYYYIAQIPGFNAIRAVTRIILVMAFPAAFVLGSFLEKLWDYRRPVGRYLVGGIVLITLVEAGWITPYREESSKWLKRVDALERETKIAAKRDLRPTDILAVAHCNDETPDTTYTNTDVMMLAHKLGVKAINGYSGNQPPAWRYLDTPDDVVDLLVAAKKFRQEHRLPPVDINPDDLVLVGFGDVDRAALAQALQAGPPAIAHGSAFMVARNPREFSRYFLGSGWVFNGDGSALSIQPEVELSLHMDQKQTARRLFLDMGAYLPNAGSTQRIRVFANGAPLGGFTFTPSANRGRYYVFLPDTLGTEVTLKIVCESPIAPPGAEEVGSSVKIGVALFGIGREDLN